MIGYKVVRKEANRLESAITEKRAKVIYKPNKWAKAPSWLAKEGYHLLFFKSIKSAISFLEKHWRGSSQRRYEIWGCKIKGEIRELPVFCDLDLLDCWGELESTWTDFWPQGTSMAKKIKLVKKIWPKEKDK